jgi:hypothetical protein
MKVATIRGYDLHGVPATRAVRLNEAGGKLVDIGGLFDAEAWGTLAAAAVEGAVAVYGQVMQDDNTVKDV